MRGDAARFIDLSCDLGEAATAAEDLAEARIWTLVTSANVACGGHTGDAASMRRAAERARTYSVALGAHPSYPDRAHFGRRTMAISAAALVDSLVEQVGALAEAAGEAGLRLEHVKPHGALYNDAHRDRPLADSIVAAVVRLDAGLAIVGSPGSALLASARQAGVKTIREGFADRRYRADGTLVPRAEEDALVVDAQAAAVQALARAEAGADTICIHADMPGSAERLEAIRAALRAAGFGFRSHAARR